MEELTFLQARQGDEAQGYYFNRPVLPEPFAQLPKNGTPEATLSGTRRLAPGKTTATPSAFCPIICWELAACQDEQTRKSPRDRKPAGCDRVPPT